jgi:hypothetical protein
VNLLVVQQDTCENTHTHTHTPPHDKKDNKAHTVSVFREKKQGDKMDDLEGKKPESES